MYAPNGVDILSLAKQQVSGYFKWGFAYVTFNPVGLAWAYGYDGQGLWKIQTEIKEPNVPPLYSLNDFCVSITKLQHLYLMKSLAVGESYIVNLPSVAGWYTRETYYFSVNANSSQISVDGAMLEYSYHGSSYDYSYWIPYNKTIVITNIWTQPLSLQILSPTFIFKPIEYEVGLRSLNFTIDSEIFDATYAGYYFTLDITRPISLKNAYLFIPNGSRADMLSKIIDDSYYTLGVVYGVYRISFTPYYAWKVIENDIYGTWRVELEAPSDSNPPIIGVPLQEPDPSSVTPEDNVTVSVNVTDLESGVQEVILSYTIDDGLTWENVTMKESMRYNSTTALYQGIIRNQIYCTWVEYKIIAYDNAGNIAVADNAGEYYIYHVIPEFPTQFTLLMLLFALSVMSIFIRKIATAKDRKRVDYDPRKPKQIAT